MADIETPRLDAAALVAWYPAYWDEEASAPYLDDYTTIYSRIGEPLVEVSDDDYQGDTRLLLRREFDGTDYYAFFTFGWGSCSGCDMLQACVTLEDYQRLCDSFTSSLRWLTLDEARDYLVAHDWEGDWSWYTDSQADYLVACRRALGVAQEDRRDA